MEYDFCPKCLEDKRENNAEECNTPQVIEINNPEQVTTFHTVFLEGTEEENPMVNGLYRNTIVKFTDSGTTYLYNSDGIPVSFSTTVNNGKLTVMVDGVNKGEFTANQAGDTVINLHDQVLPLYHSTGQNTDGPIDQRVTTNAIAAEAALRTDADNTLQGNITAEATARENAVSAEALARSQAVTNEANARTDADTALQDNITAEATARGNADTALQGNITAEANARSAADTALQGNINLKQDIMQYYDMPVAGQTMNGRVVQFVGTSSSSYTNGFFYKCTYDSGTETYSWVRHNTQPNGLEQVVVTGSEVYPTTSPSTVTLRNSKVNTNTGETSQATVAFPVASSSQAGVMNTATFDAVQENSENIDSILGGTVSISGLPSSPTQAELTTAWQNETGRSELINGAKINDSTNSKTWTYYSNVSSWEYTSNQPSFSVNTWTNNTLGIAKGSLTEGQIFAESDGTGSVNGWDTLLASVASKEPSVPVGTSSQFWRGDKTWQSLTKSDVGLGNVDNTSDATKKSNFTGSIASTDTGFITGDTAYTALATKEPTISAGTTSQYWRGDKTWQTLGDATLTIQKNGTQIGTFSANATNNSTVNITSITSSDVIETGTVPQVVTTGMIADNAVTTEKIDLSDLIDVIYPVGSIYMSVNNVSPQTFFGGTWVYFGQGRTVVGVSQNDTDFNAPELTGGAKSKTLSATIGACNGNIGALGYITDNSTTYQQSHNATYVIGGDVHSFTSWNHSTPVVEKNSASRDTSIMQPYVTAYMWKRTS